MTREEALEDIELDRYVSENYGEYVISEVNARNLVERIFNHFDKELRKAWIEGSNAAHDSFMDMVERQRKSKDD